MFKTMLATAIIFVAANAAAETSIPTISGDVGYRCPPAGTQLNPAWVEWAKRQDRAYSLLGIPKPTWLNEQIKMVIRCGLAQ